MKNLIRRFVPDTWIAHARALRAGAARRRRRAAIPLTDEQLRGMLHSELGVRPGSVVFVHSSSDALRTESGPHRILSILREAVGEGGTLLFPTYPRLASLAFLESDQVFDVRRSPSYTGLLSELARRHGNARRSLHPTKSVCAIGPHAEALTSTHHLSPYPYDAGSPYYRILEHDAVVIGLGVSTDRLSFTHVIDDHLKDEFPFDPYFPRTFSGRCIDASGTEVVVQTLAHDPRKMTQNVPQFVERHVPPSVARDFEVQGVPFFFARAQALFDVMTPLARKGITIYGRKRAA